MTSLYAAEKFFFNPRRPVEGPGVGGSRRGLSRSVGALSGDSSTGGGRRGSLVDRRGSIRALRRTVGRGHVHLPPVVRDDVTFTAATRRPDRKSESLTDLPSVSEKGRTKRRSTLLYGSHPVLSVKGHMADVSRPEVPVKSEPAGLQYAGIGDMTSLPDIAAGKLKFGDQLLADDEAVTSPAEESSDETDSQDEDNEITKMHKERELDKVMAQKDVESNWILKNDIDKMQKKFERRKKRLKITIAEEDPMVVIEKRLREVKQMTRVKRDQRHVLARFTPEVRDLILKYKDIPVADIRNRQKKKGNKLIDRFRHAVSLVRLLLRGFQGSQRYYLDTTNQNQLRHRIESLVEQPSGAPTGRASIGYDMQKALTTQPHLRDKSHIKQILWMLRATKAFTHLFPAEMEREVARMVSYERYEDSRIIAYQSRTPDRFYYVLSGRVNLIRQYKLSTGQVTKSMGFLTKGMTTDPQEVDRQWMREDSLVCKGQVEVLLLDRKVSVQLKQPFSALQHTTDGPPLDFIQALHLFLEFPVERFRDHMDAIEVKYYGQGKIIIVDSNRTPWLHIVKSGLVKVVRRQKVIDVRLSNESKFMAPTVEHLGCGKTFSHAQAMLGVQAKQRKIKSQKASSPALPMVPDASDVTTNPFADTVGFRKPVIFRQPADENVVNETHCSEVESDASPSPGPALHGGSPGEEFEPHDLWLTREKTGHDTVVPARARKASLPNRQAHLQMDVLKPGDVFGLDHLQPAVASEPQGVSLLSDGAEVIKISKRFFLQNAANNTMLKVETMYKEYMTEDEAKSVIYNKETWDQYKSAMWSRMTAPSPVSTVSKR